MEWVRILGLLLRKNWLVRKKLWVLCLFVQILLPVSILFFGRVIFDAVTGFEIRSKLDNISGLTQISNIPFGCKKEVMYAPTNDFIKKLMLKFRDCWRGNLTLLEFSTEDHLIGFNANSTLRRAAIVFNESTNYSTRHLNYKIRASLPISDLYKPRYLGVIINYYKSLDPFLQIQTCLDESFIKIKINHSDVQAFPRMFIQRMPYPTPSERLSTNPYIDLTYTLTVITCFTIPLFIEMLTATNEKFGGIHILMSMNGIPSILNFLSWAISGLTHLCGICVIIIIFMFPRLSEDSYALNNYINPLVLFTFFIAHNLHMMAFGIHISAYFTKPILVTFAYLIFNIAAIFVHILILEENYLHMVPYVGIIFPNMFLIQTMNNINFYKKNGIYIQWTNMFENSKPSLRIENSIGMTMILSIKGMIIHFLFAFYVYAINPGKYGIGKHPLFLFMSNSWDMNSSSIENCIYDGENKELFELASGYTAGIQIRNLQKTYNVGLFNRQKVQALRGLSIDFYKGQITALLGHNGAGKSTLMSILTGMIKPTTGTVLIDSKMLKDNASKLLKDVGLCAQDDMYFSSLTVTEQLEFFAKVKKRSQEGVQTLLQKLKLFNVKDALPDSLSADQRRKLCLAIAFVGDPNVLILDEPTSRLDHESKRLIWDILMEMKGRKTILVSTHDMHEADLLADRIAIMHDGRLKCYGSSLYLKAVIGGQNNIEVTLTIERWSDPDTICKQIDCDAEIIQSQGKKIIMSVSTSSIKSTFLKNLENKKSELGVVSYRLSIASLEQVFIKAIQENESSHEAVSSNIVKLKGAQLNRQMVRALLYKNMTYTLKESSTLLIQILMVFIALVSVFMTLGINTIMIRHAKRINISPAMYSNAYTLYTSVDKIIGEKYKKICQQQGANTVGITNTSLYSELMRRAKEDLVDYNKKLIAAAEFNETTDGYTVNAFYSEEIFYSLPISINLAANVIVKNILGDDYSISLSEQQFPYIDGVPMNKDHQYPNLGRWLAVLFVIPLYFLIAMFVIRPARESSRGLKHLQKMTGVSGFTYWGTLFLSDMVQYTFLVSLLVIGLAFINYCFHMQLFRVKEIIIMILFLMLFAMSSLPLVYMVSFIKAKTNTLVKLVVFSCIGIGSVEIMFYVTFSEEYYLGPMFVGSLPSTFRHLQRRIWLLVPHISFFHAQIVLYTTGLKIARCRKLTNRFFDMYCENKKDYCCNLNCYDGECQMDMPYSKFENISLDDIIQILCITSVINFCLLAILEAKLIKKIKLGFGKKDLAYLPVNEQMLHLKSMIFQTIQSLDRRSNENESKGTRPKVLNSTALLTYGLRKYYKKIKAVEDVSFIVNREECFGILGMNRAGKSVALRIISGEEVPDQGLIFLGDKNFRNNYKLFLSQIGYCRQQEAIIKCLNSYDHLSLFARLRGVPEKLIENEVQTWINRLNLGACASLPTSAYSSGNKQRLNIAIALIGDPQLILLDEPTIRVDPAARRSFWNTIKNCQAAGQSVLLASHNMEECEVLCNRMAIMVEGTLTCIGTSAELKQRFGAGYDVQIRMDPRKANAQLDGIKNSMRLLLDCTLTNQNAGSLLYYVSGPGTTWKRLYDVLNKLKDKYECIDDYIVIVRLSH